MKIIFKVGANHLIGIDVGFSSIKVAEVIRSGKKFQLVNFAYEDLPEGSIIDAEIHQLPEVTTALINCFQKSGIKNKNVVLGLFGPSSTMFKKVEISQGTKDEMEDQIFWEAEQYLPFDSEDANIAYHMVGENEGGGIIVIVAAAKKEMVKVYSDLVEMSGLTPHVFDLNLMSISNLYEVTASEDEKKENPNTLFVDFGGQYTKLMLLKEGIPVFSREINLGGYNITEDIQRKMGITFSEAENLKIFGDGQGNYPEDILTIMASNMSNVIGEIKKTISFYMTTVNQDNIHFCYITGGSSLLPGLIDKLAEALEVKVKLFDPLAKMSISKKIESEALDNFVRYRGATALGLALREINE